MITGEYFGSGQSGSAEWFWKPGEYFGSEGFHQKVMNRAEWF